MHFNPWGTTINGNLEDGDRNFRYGAALGFDAMVSDDVRFVTDYLYQASEEKGNRDQHSAEFGLDWEFAEEQTISIATEIELDGDEAGNDFTVSLQYMIDIPGPVIGG